MDQKKTGDFIAMLRKEKGLTQQELAGRLHISNKTVSKWECGDGMPDITLLPALAAELGVTADDLLRGEQGPAVASPDGVQEEGLSCLWDAAFLRFRTSLLACLLAPPLGVASVICADRIFSIPAMMAMTALLFGLSLFGSILFFFYASHQAELAARQYESRSKEAYPKTIVFWKQKKQRLFAEIAVLSSSCMLFVVVVCLQLF